MQMLKLLLPDRLLYYITCDGEFENGCTDAQSDVQLFFVAIISDLESSQLFNSVVN